MHVFASRSVIQHAMTEESLTVMQWLTQKHVYRWLVFVAMQLHFDTELLILVSTSTALTSAIKRDTEWSVCDSLQQLRPTRKYLKRLLTCTCMMHLRCLIHS